MATLMDEIVSAPALPMLGEDELAHAERLTDHFAAEYLEHYRIMPVRVENGRAIVATSLDTPDEQALDDLRIALECEIDLYSTPQASLSAAIQRVYGKTAETAEGMIAEMPDDVIVAHDGGDAPLDDLVTLANEAPVVKLVNLLLLEALRARASDVHLEGHGDGLRVRYRIDGVLQEAPSPPAQFKSAVVSRLKIMAELDIAERRLPQDGRIRLRLQNRQVDVRVSTLPTLHGESVVLRLLDKEGGRVGLRDLGMAEDTVQAFCAATERSHGIVLSTGPTGSGKTTTLYAAIDHIRTGREKILTVEDPVEYELAGVPQVQVHEKIGLTFATALRALLRQDPDVLLIGEIRDQDTADIATHAALTGHLVLSTLHTNDAPTAIARLLDLGVAPYLVASTVEAVLAQRLVRRICPSCAVQTPADSSKTVALFSGDDAPPASVFIGRGCVACRHTGYHGRIGIYELLLVDDVIRDAILLQSGTARLHALAVARGMRTLREDGKRLVRAGVTTPDEVLRVT